MAHTVAKVTSGQRMTIKEDFDEFKDVMLWVDIHTSGLTLDGGPKSLIVVGCLDVTLEHQAAIALLFDAGLYGSLMALLRVQTEALVRGLWFQECATDEDVRRFQKGKFDKTFAELITEYEAKIGTPEGVLSGFKRVAWKALNGFTHTGMHQITRRHSPGKVEANYSEEELGQSLGISGTLGLLACGTLLILGGRQDLVPAYFERADRFSKASRKSEQK
jgi:hypothetical protein